MKILLSLFLVCLLTAPVLAVKTSDDVGSVNFGVQDDGSSSAGSASFGDVGSVVIGNQDGVNSVGVETYDNDNDEYQGIGSIGVVEEIRGGANKPQNFGLENLESNLYGDDNSARIHLVKTYATQQNSPVEWRPTLDELSEGIEEYGVSFWFKWDFLWKDDYQFQMSKTQEKIEVAFITNNKDSAYRENNDPHDKNIRVYLDLTTAYAPKLIVAGATNQRVIDFPHGNFDNQWAFFQVAYSHETKKIFGAIKFEGQNDWHTFSMEEEYEPITTDNKLYFRLANTHDNHTLAGWNGYFKEILFSYGPKGHGPYKEAVEDFDNYYTSLSKYNPHVELGNDAISLTGNSNGLVTTYDVVFNDENPQLTKTANNINFPVEYAISGWFKVSTQANIQEKRLLYKVSTKNTAIGGGSSTLGEKTLQAELDGNRLIFTTYNIADLSKIDSQNIVDIPIDIDDYENDVYIYHGYSRTARQAGVYVQTYDTPQGIKKIHEVTTNNELLHMRSDDYVITLGKDQHHNKNFHGKMACFEFEYGSGSYISDQTRLTGIANDLHAECAKEGDRPVLSDDVFSLQSYNYPTLYLSHGNPSFLTDDYIAGFNIVAGLIGDVDTISFRSALVEEGAAREDFYWRHQNSLIKEMHWNGEDELFAKDASFIIWQNKFIDGTIALESANYRGYFLRHQNWNIRISEEEDSDSFREDASWTFAPRVEPNEQDADLVPVWRLEDKDGNIQITISDEKRDQLLAQGFEVDNQENGSNVLGFAWDRVPADEHASAIFEFQNPDTGVTYYTADPNSAPEGYVFNYIAFYAYPMRYERTIPVYQFTHKDGGYHWVSDEAETSTIRADTINYHYVQKQFWLFESGSDPCQDNIDQCGPVIPDPCDSNVFYRPTQDSECQECDGELEHYAKELGDKNKFYTAICHHCIGGWEVDEDGDRVCLTCPNGTWVFETEGEPAECYPDCDASVNQFLNLETMECKTCPGELVAHDLDVPGLMECIDCPYGTEIAVDCGNDLIRIDSCLEGEVELSRRQRCYECPNGWEGRNVNGENICVRVCQEENQYVTEDDRCEVCEDGFVYDDGTTTARCGSHQGDGPFEYPDTGIDNTWTYDVPSDQVDDIKEYAFFMWVRFQYYNPKKLDYNLWRTTDARIGGFVTAENDGLEAWVHANTDESEAQSFLFTGQQEANYASITLVDRKDWDYEWNLVYMGQGMDGTAVAYVYSNRSKTGQFTVFDSQTVETSTGMSFQLHRKQGDTLLPLGFQGTYANVELKFAVGGLVPESQGELENYLFRQGYSISTPPPIFRHVAVHDLFESQTEIDLSTKSNEEKQWTFSDLHGTRQYAVYGWFKKAANANPNATNAGKQILFNLKDKVQGESDQWGLARKVGDQALQSYIDNEELVNASYTTTPFAHGGYTDVSNETRTSLERDTFEEWFFIYQAFNGRTNEAWTYFTTIMGTEEVWSLAEGPSWHFRAEAQTFSLGHWPDSQNDPSQVNFNGLIYNGKVQYGNVCEFHEEECIHHVRKEMPTPLPEGQCVIMYDEPQYKGGFIYVCYENERFNMNIESIYIPEGVEFKIWDSAQFEGLTILYTETQPHISGIDFNLLLAQKIPGMQVLKNARYYELLGINPPANLVAKKPAAKKAAEGGIRINQALREQKAAAAAAPQEDMQLVEQTSTSSFKASHLRRQL